MKKSIIQITTVTALSIALIGTMTPKASAEGLFGLWLKPKIDFVSGTGDIFKKFEGSPAGGAEVGLTLLGVSLWGDVEFMTSDQYWGSLNLGYAYGFGKKLHLSLGAYIGALWFAFPDDPQAETVDALTPEMSDSISALLEPAGINYSQFQSGYNDALESLDQISNNAFGVNGRLRVALEYRFAGPLAIGVQGLFGYHYIMSGEDAAGSLKSVAVDRFVDAQSLDGLPVSEATFKSELKEAIGAKESSLEDLQGLHYSIGLFLNFSI